MAQTDDAKRATTAVTIAQVRFKQALRKEEQDSRLPGVSVEDSSQFLSDIDAVLEQNSPANVQVSDNNTIDHETLGAD